MSREEAVIRFEDVSFEFGHNKPILREVNFSVRRGTKIALMGQNGAGKSTLFSLITGVHQPESGKINIPKGLSIATARQSIQPEERALTVRAFFEKCFSKKVYDIDPRIDKILKVVHLSAPHDRLVGSFSGGQQARLLLASALIQDPDLLLLDEPTNNLDKAGIEHLTKFLIDYKKTCLVISHDAEFLNAFTQGVLYLDVHTHVMEQYAGNYNDVLAEITARIEKENRKNAQLAKEIQEKKDQSNMFANKGGQMRLVAKRMREKAEELEEEMVEVRKEDRTIRSFTIPSQPELVGDILYITSFSVMRPQASGKGSVKLATRKVDIPLKRNTHLLLKGPNGIGKSTLLEALASGKASGAIIAPGVRVGYYRQDFSTLNYEDTVYDSLLEALESAGGRVLVEHLRSTAAGFLISAEMMRLKIGHISDGQKGLVSFARLVLQKPGLLILDEPTNHINFRHLPVIADALNRYEGAMILVSHVPDFVEKIRIDEVLDLEK